LLDSAAKDFVAAFDALVAAKREIVDDVGAQVAAIVADVRHRGDAALVDYTRRFDKFDVTEATLRVGVREIDEAAARAPAPARAALEVAAQRIEDYHRRQMPTDLDYVDAAGLRLGARWSALDAAGIYVPGGTAAYPSSVLMNAVPARVAGVRRLVMTVPSPGGVLNPLVMAAAKLVRVDEVYRVGGALAVAALAYGTATIAPVDKITGPGNAYVAAAKRLVFGEVGIDMIAGPSEVVVVADRHNDPAWIAADLLAQAEHDTAAQSILIVDDRAFGRGVAQAVEAELVTLPRARIARASWEGHGAIVVVGNLLSEAPALIDRLAPEHLQIATERPDDLARKVRHAGAIFLGRYAPEALGDYVAGPNHVLPTSRSARFASGLGVLDFLKRTSIIGADADGLAAIGGASVTLAEAEGLGAHARSVAIRLNRRAP
jgi:histidinol dehydrogenase